MGLQPRVEKVDLDKIDVNEDNKYVSLPVSTVNGDVKNILYLIDRRGNHDVENLPLLKNKKIKYSDFPEEIRLPFDVNGEVVYFSYFRSRGAPGRDISWSESGK